VSHDIILGFWTGFCVLLNVAFFGACYFAWHAISRWAERNRKARAEAKATWDQRRPGKTEPPPIVTKPLGGIRDPYCEPPKVLAPPPSKPVTDLDVARIKRAINKRKPKK